MLLPPTGGVRGVWGGEETGGGGRAEGIQRNVAWPLSLAFGMPSLKNQT